jgi:GNAT superfamily N-acetyltransferase
MIRLANSADAEQLLALMRRLAEFEGYADRFAVTVEQLIARGLASRSQFSAWVADERSKLIGYCAAYVVPYTFDLRPTVVLKELFVETERRGSGVGKGLFDAVLHFAQSEGARLVRWQVLPDNASASEFYRRRGGVEDVAWANWFLDLDMAVGSRGSIGRCTEIGD